MFALLEATVKMAKCYVKTRLCVPLHTIYLPNPQNNRNGWDTSRE